MMNGIVFCESQHFCIILSTFTMGTANVFYCRAYCTKETASQALCLGILAITYT